ncbi:TetR/AcrR family transcriptional regulator [Variovorax paradoxus]|uniref:TetR/AcrR family transcriptional regulator n=1 Tax=Variovorax paradoxus TaxID=34073 RepID=UPI0019344784|nr:TetR/AcrR family transcriptional regulator [Variovorax paradoxus]
MSSEPVARPRSGPRNPVRKHAQERFDALLDATEQLLAHNQNEEISLAQIADIAGVPLASVYHFFPNRNAAFVALAQRFHAELWRLAAQPHDPMPETWQEMVERNQRRSSSYLNAHPAALRLFMGAGVSVQVRNLDMHGNTVLTRMRVDQFVRYFETPRIPDFEKRLAVALAISDGVWALSYSAHGRITDEYITESVRAAVVYLRCFMPEVLEPRR